MYFLNDICKYIMTIILLTFHSQYQILLFFEDLDSRILKVFQTMSLKKRIINLANMWNSQHLPAPTYCYIISNFVRQFYSRKTF